MSGEYEDEELEQLLRAPSTPLGVVQLGIRDALRELGLINPLSQRLGAGNFGVAYRVMLGGDGSSVLKVTRDPFELIACLGLEGKRTRNVVPIHKVWAIPGTAGNHGRFLPWYIVHRSLLNPLSERDARLVEVMYEQFMERKDLKFPTPNAHAMRQRWRTVLQEFVETKTEADRALTMLDAIAAGARELADVGIDWTDMHSDNLMRDDRNVLRIVDVGYNNPRHETKLVAPPLTIESAREYAKAVRAA